MRASRGPIPIRCAAGRKYFLRKSDVRRILRAISHSEITKLEDRVFARCARGWHTQCGSAGDQVTALHEASTPKNTELRVTAGRSRLRYRSSLSAIASRG